VNILKTENEMKIMKQPKLSKETMAARAMGRVEKDKRSIIPPLYSSTTYERNADLSFHEGRTYTRADNPTYQPVTELLTRLENGKSAQVFASGMAACVAVFQALQPGAHIIIPQGVYYGIRHWLEVYGQTWGLRHTAILEGDVAALKQSIIPGKTKIVWIETPSNPLWKITDIAAFAEVAHRQRALVVVDNTVATPVLTCPLDLGADLVMHSATKFLNGHGDVLIGALITKRENEFWQSIVAIAHDSGPLPGSFEAWLLLRGMRTLFLRMERICSNALNIAGFLSAHPKIHTVYYPGLMDFPGHEIARKQMQRGFGGMLSIRLKGGQNAAVRVQANIKVFKRATSLGLTESLMEHRASYEGLTSQAPDDLLRLSIGIENVDDLIADLKQALERA
jgi:cystathionine gamma-synthase